LNDNRTKKKSFESEIKCRLSSINTVVEFATEMRRMLNSWVARAERTSEELKKSKIEVRKMWRKLSELEKVRQSSSLVQPSGNRNLFEEGHSRHKRIRNPESFTGGVDTEDPQNGDIAEDRSIDNISIYSRISKCHLPSAMTLLTDSENSNLDKKWIHELKAEKGKLKQELAKARFDLKVTTLQRDRYNAQIGELRHTCDIFRHTNKTTKEYWGELEARFDQLEAQIEEFKTSDKEKIPPELRKWYGKNLVKKQHRIVRSYVLKTEELVKRNRILHDQLKKLIDDQAKGKQEFRKMLKKANSYKLALEQHISNGSETHNKIIALRMDILNIKMAYNCHTKQVKSMLGRFFGLLKFALSRTRFNYR